MVSHRHVLVAKLHGRLGHLFKRQFDDFFSGADFPETHTEVLHKHICHVSGSLGLLDFFHSKREHA